MRKASIALIALAAVVAVSPAGAEELFSKKNIGTVLGGVGGAVVGSQFGSGKGRLVGVAAGTLLGAFVGREIGSSLDEADQTAASRSAQNAFETGRTGQTVAWRNPDSGNEGTITPVRTYEASPGSYCREYQQTVTVGGKTEEAYGTACRQPDGSWKIVN